MTTFVLPATEDTVRVGVIDPTAAPVLTVADGDEVILETLGPWGGRVVDGTQISDFPQIKAHFPDALGPHSLTGPIRVSGTQPGDTLAVDVLGLRTITHGYNMVIAQPRGRGVLRDRFPEGHIRHFTLDPESGTTQLGHHTLPLRPFLGIMGVAPADDGVRSTVEPGTFGGNIDLAELVAGSTLYLPVFRPGAGFFCGDGHGMQGDGEVNQTAIETGMESAHLRFRTLTGEHPANRLRTPRAETPTHLISLGFGATLEKAARAAVDDMVTWLATDHTGAGMPAWSEPLTEQDAYTLCSLAASVRVTQAVNGVVGAHAMLPKNLNH